MKKFLLTFLALLIASPLFASITRVQSKTATTNAASSLSLVLDSAPTNGNLIVLIASSGGSTPPQVDSDANITWFGPTKSGASTAFGTLYVGWVRTASASATITISTQASTNICASAAEYSGFTYARVDRTQNATGSSTSAASGATATTSSAAELWIGGLVSRGSGGVTFSSPTNSFTIVGQTTTTTSTASDRSVALLERIVSSTGTANAGATISSSNVWVAIVATFDESPNGGGAAAQRSIICGQ